MEEGRTPWMAIHPYTRGKEMLPARIGATYLAQKTDAWIIPTALYLEGGPMNLDTPAEMAAQAIGRLRGKTKANYFVGEPIKLDPIENFTIIEDVLRKRATKEKVTSEELAEFTRVHKALKEQATSVAQTMAELLPPEHRGKYAEEVTEDE